MSSQPLRHLFNRLARDTRAVGAVEFAILLPLLLILLVGAVDLTRMINNSRKVTLLARTISDLTAQGDSNDVISADNMNDIIASSKLVLTPFSDTGTSIKVSAMGVYLPTPGAKPYVCSSYSKNAVARPVKAYATDLTVPAQYLGLGKRYIYTEVTSSYTFLLGSGLLTMAGLPTSKTLTMVMPWPPRGGAAVNSSSVEVILPGGAACPLVAI